MTGTNGVDGDRGVLCTLSAELSCFSNIDGDGKEPWTGDSGSTMHLIYDDSKMYIYYEPSRYESLACSVEKACKEAWDDIQQVDSCVD